MGSFMLAEIRAIRTCEATESTSVPFCFLMLRADMCLQLGMRRRHVTAFTTHIGPVATVGTLVIVLGLVRRKRLVASFPAAGVRPVTRMCEEMATKFRPLFEVFIARLAALPLAETAGTLVDVGSLYVFVQCLRTVECFETGHVGGVLPFADRQWDIG